MSKTPISQFLDTYSESGVTRLHMPGHKGAGFSDDITEVSGADSLYEAEGIIRESERNASTKFGSRSTFYGTEGSSQIIKAMCFLAIKQAKANGRVDNDRTDSDRADNDKAPVILATRNAHKSFIHAAMLLRFDIVWITSEEKYDLCRCVVSPNGLKNRLDALEEDIKSRLAAVFVTSPDYLGNILDIEGLSKVVHGAGLMLLVDNAHGSYLRFMEKDMHPISLGADMCADSAHKTLPVLTGGAYLHVSSSAPEGLEDGAKDALLMFGSTSPSYLILRSLDEANVKVKSETYIETASHVKTLKGELEALGFKFTGDEPLKLTFDMRDMPYNSMIFAEHLRRKNIECEYADYDYIVMMWSPWNKYPEDYDRVLEEVKKLSDEMNEILKKAEEERIQSEDTLSEEEKDYEAWLREEDDEEEPFTTRLPEVKFQPWEILYMPHKKVRVETSLIGCVVYDAHIGCPPAVSPIVAGEVVDKNVLNILQYYSVTEIEIIE